MNTRVTPLFKWRSYRELRRPLRFRFARLASKLFWRLRRRMVGALTNMTRLTRRITVALAWSTTLARRYLLFTVRDTYGLACGCTKARWRVNCRISRWSRLFKLPTYGPWSTPLLSGWRPLRDLCRVVLRLCTRRALT